MNRDIHNSWKHIAVRHIKAVLVTVPFLGAVIWLLAVWHGNSWLDKHSEFIIVNVVYTIIVLHLTWQIVDHRCPEFFGIPRVRKILQKEKVILVEGAPWLGIGVMTTLYIVEDDLERFLSFGEVTNVQYNNMVQIALRPDTDSHEFGSDVWAALDRTDKKALLVKPGSYRGSV